jgi:hypothetical protein
MSIGFSICTGLKVNSEPDQRLLHSYSYYHVTKYLPLVLYRMARRGRADRRRDVMRMILHVVCLYGWILDLLRRRLAVPAPSLLLFKAGYCSGYENNRHMYALKSSLIGLFFLCIVFSPNVWNSLKIARVVVEWETKSFQRSLFEICR